MPELRWLPEALADLQRLHSFLRDLSPDAAQRSARAILAGADKLQDHPRAGQPLDDDRREWFIPFGVGAYVLRYRLDADGNPVVIRVWHSREDRERTETEAEAETETKSETVAETDAETDRATSPTPTPTRTRSRSRSRSPTLIPGPS